MKQNKFQKLALFVLPVLAVSIALVLFLPGGLKPTVNTVNAAELPPNTEASDVPTGGPFGCTIGNIAVFSGRIHVFCSNAVAPAPRYFAAWGDSAHALATNRFLTLLDTAYALGKPVYIYYFDDTSLNPTGCNASDCRAIDWIFIVP
jgi:hypothetical protein